MKPSARKRVVKSLPPRRWDEKWRSEIRIDPKTAQEVLRRSITLVQHESYLHRLLRDREDRYRISVRLPTMTDFEADALYMWNERGLRRLGFLKP